MSSSKHSIPDRRELEKKYELKRHQYEDILYDIQQRLIEVIKGFMHPTIKGRVKSFDSYYNKLLKRLTKFNDINIANDITDILGIRIICPFLENIKTIEELIDANYDIIESDHKGMEHSFKEFGYVSTHHLIAVPNDILSNHQVNKDLICEIQICTTLQDAWSEIEHELVYKAEYSPYDETVKRKLAALNANLTLSDILFQEIRDYQKKIQSELNKRRNTFIKQVETNDIQYLEQDIIEQDVQMNVVKKEDTSSDNNKPVQYNNVRYKINDLLLEALDAHNNNHFSKAIEIYTKILTYNTPKNIQIIVHIHRGIANFAEANYNYSIKDFTNALALDKDNYKALYYRGLIQRFLHNYQFSLNDLNRCIELEPYKFYPYYNRAQVYLHLNDYPSALSDCEKALKIKPDSPKVLKFIKIIKSRMNLEMPSDFL
ncbi:MAG: tetratricopeptide repeat protein [Spirochaetota bacterium]|nr:tetratricopeptide repeat protein [Spirochaetota bacterium]